MHWKSSKNATETCEIDSTCTWEDHIFNKSHWVFLVQSKDRSKQTWQYVLVDLDKVDAFIIQFNTGRGNVSDYGTVLYSGRDQDPPKDIVHKVNLRFMSRIIIINTIIDIIIMYKLKSLRELSNICSLTTLNIFIFMKWVMKRVLIASLLICVLPSHYWEH